MPIHLSWPRRGAFLLAVAALLYLATLAAGPPAANAASTQVDLRVVAPTGATLAEQIQYTRTVRVKTDPRADCFGEGNEGSGKRVKVRGVTPLGAVVDGARNRKRLRPVSVTDAFDFGLGVCGIGGFDFEQDDSDFWYVKRNHAGLQVGSDQVRLDRGDQVLWYLAPGFPPPPELELVADNRTKPGPLGVRVFEYADDGTRMPAEGAAVSGADQPTGKNGRTTVDLAAPGTAKLRATRQSDGAIPSNVEKVCIAQKRSACPKQPGTRIGGSGKRDEVKGTPGPDRINTKGGKDRIDAVDGEQDRVNCGGGKRDLVLADPADRLRRCERVRLAT